MTHDYKNSLDVQRIIDALNDTSYSFASLAVAWEKEIRAALQLAQEAEQVRRERDELAAYILEVDDSCRTLFGDEAHELAKKVSTENGE